MKYVKVGSAIVLVLTAIWILASLVALAGVNDLFVESDWGAAAGVSLAVIAVSILGYMAIGIPWARWRRTPYW